MTDPLPTQHPTASSASEPRSRSISRPQRARLDPVTAARARPSSKALAIRAKCYDCQGGNADPGVVERIRDCPAPNCPLYAVRPYQRRASQ